MELEKELVVEPYTLVDWRQLYLDYLHHEVLPTDQTEARRLARRAKSFVIIEGELYKQCLARILQRRIPIEQGNQLMKDIHDRVCGQHVAPSMLVGNAFRRGFY
jgi:hypothetical protein